MSSVSLWWRLLEAYLNGIQEGFVTPNSKKHPNTVWEAKDFL
ncbi:hypothetical protein CKA32_004844 [Geitlerinema sp. FC II]|nr:hypothetical protein CKA32_004844 [Geitlerinema sp. FC II]